MFVAFDLPHRETSKSLDEHKIRLNPRRTDLFSRHLSSDGDQGSEKKNLKKIAKKSLFCH